jgi:hypothetical protein
MKMGTSVPLQGLGALLQGRAPGIGTHSYSFEDAVGKIPCQRPCMKESRAGRKAKGQDL